MITFLEFMDIVKGYKFSLKGTQIFNFQLFWNRVNPYDLIAGKTKYDVDVR